MRQPCHAIAALVSQAAAHRGEGIIIRHDHATFTGGDLFVGIKSKDTGTAERSDGALAVIPAEAFAAIFDQHEFMLLGELFEFDHSTGMTKNFHGDNRLGFRCDRGFDFADIHVQRFRIDIDEDRFGTDE